MRSGGVVTGQNVSLAALLRTGVYEVCAVWGAGVRSGAVGRLGGCASLLRWFLSPSNATAKLQRKAPFLAFSSSLCRQAFQKGLNKREK